LGYLRGCHNLASVFFYACNIDNSGVEMLSQGCPFIHSWDLTECRQIGNLGIKALAISCNLSLKKISLRGCKRVGDSGLLSLSYHCKNIEDLDLFYLNKLTDCSINSLKECTQLKKLILPGPSLKFKISDQILLNIILHCKFIETLSTSGTDITDKSLKEIASKLNLLKQLDISECKKLTKRGILELTKNLYLEELIEDYMNV